MRRATVLWAPLALLGLTTACSETIPASPTCTDGVRNADESGVDCGGRCGATCLVGAACRDWGDCLGGNCTDGRCGGVPCDGDPCFGRGACDVDGTCACEGGFSGPRCETCASDAGCDGGPGLVTTLRKGFSSEAGDAARISVRLNAAPTQAVVIAVTSGRPDEAAPIKASLTVGPLLWWQPVEFTLVGVDDGVDDGDQPYSVTLAARSGDVGYDGLEAVVGGLTNRAGRCGNGVVEAPEACDDPGAGPVVCAYGAADCGWCDAGCGWVAQMSPACGDGVIQQRHEACDGEALAGCVDGAPGDLACGAKCTPSLALAALWSVAADGAASGVTGGVEASDVQALACGDSVWVAVDGVLSRVSAQGAALAAVSVAGQVVALAGSQLCEVTATTVAPSAQLRVQGDGWVVARGPHQVGAAPVRQVDPWPTWLSVDPIGGADVDIVAALEREPGVRTVVGSVRTGAVRVGVGDQHAEVTSARGWDLFVVQSDGTAGDPWARVFGGAGDDRVRAARLDGAQLVITGVSDGGMAWTGCAGGVVPRPTDEGGARVFVATLAPPGGEPPGVVDPCAAGAACAPMVEVPAGHFMAGCAPDDPRCAPDELSPPVATWVGDVAIDRDETLVSGGSTWDEARAACAARGLGLCRAAAWEKAARGTDLRIYPWGGAAPGSVADVSAYGVRDMVTGATEWLANRAPTQGGMPRFEVRGGSLDDGGADPRLRLSARGSAPADARVSGRGFRCCTCPPGGCATCDDRVRNGVETGVDCGGDGGCPRCGDGQGCDADADCLGVCEAGTCEPAAYAWVQDSGVDSVFIALGSQCTSTCTYEFECASQHVGKPVFVVETSGFVIAMSLGSVLYGTTFGGRQRLRRYVRTVTCSGKGTVAAIL